MRKQKKPGIREVAAQARVGTTSVSRVLSDHPDVSEGMRSRVMAAVERLGYTPNRLAQGLRGSGTFLVGCLLGDISNPLMSEIVHAAEEVLGQNGYSMLLTDSRSEFEQEARHLKLLEERQIDGLILSTASEHYQPTLDLLNNLSCPTVAIDRKFPDNLKISSVHSNHQQGMTDATNKLLDLGHRRIDLIIGSDIRPMRERRAALSAAFDNRGLRRTFRIYSGPMTSSFAASSVTEALASELPPTAIVLGGNQFLAGVLTALRDFNMRVGRNISLIACDDVPLAQLYEPPISVIKRDTSLLGHTAALLLLRQIKDNSEPQIITLPTVYEERSSTIPPVRDS